MQATALATNDVASVAPNALQRRANAETIRCAPSNRPVSWKIPEYDEEMHTISITLTMETMPPPSISGATRSSAQWKPNTSARASASTSICCTRTHTGNAVRILAHMVMRTSTRATASTTSTTAGRTVVQCRQNALPNNPRTSNDPAEGCVHSAKAAYAAQVSAKGTAAVRTMSRMFSKMFVCVSVLTSWALVDTGEHRSPK